MKWLNRLICKILGHRWSYEQGRVYYSVGEPRTWKSVYEESRTCERCDAEEILFQEERQ